MTQASGPPVSTHVKRDGPVVVIITTARDNVEDELLTRLVMSDADESGKQPRPCVRASWRKRSGASTKRTSGHGSISRRWLEADVPTRP